MSTSPTSPTTNTSLSVRRLEARDQVRWFELWAGYCRFYEHEPDAEVAAFTWQRLMSDTSSISGIVAVDSNELVIGIGNYLLHENTSTLTPVCYLQDLFVDPTARANGAGKLMLDWLLDEMKVKGWARVYWATKENNYRARGLYDKYTPHSGFLRYVVYNKS